MTILATLPKIPLPQTPKPTHTLLSLDGSNDTGLPPAVTAGEALAGLPQLDKKRQPQSIYFEPFKPESECTIENEPGPFARWCRGDNTSTDLANHAACDANLEAVSVAQTPCLATDRPAATVLTKPSPRWHCRHPTDTWRYLSPREAARLQSFPDQLQLRGSVAQQYKQVGNAVPVRLAHAIAVQIVTALEKVVAQGAQA